MVPEHLVRVIICDTRRRIVCVIVVCRLLEPSRNWRLGRIDIQEYHIRITLLDCVWILITLGLVVLPIISCDSNAWTGSHFHRARKSVIVNVVDIRLYASYSARFSRHTYHF